MNSQIKLKHNFGFTWNSSGKNHAKGYGWDEDGNYYKDADLLKYIDKIESNEQVIQKINKLNGCFSFVLCVNDCVVLVTDLTRTFPLFYSYLDGDVWISDCSIYLAAETKSLINSIHLEEFLVAGYVFSDGTIFNEVHATKANTVLIIQNSRIHSFNTLKFRVQSEDIEDNTLLSTIDKHFVRIANQIVKSANGRTIVIPLSGGLDSRAIVAMLFKLNYSNVICYTYGKKSSEEYKISKKVADILGYQHIFIEYKDEIWKNVFSESNSIFFEYAFNGVSLPHYQDMYAIGKLHENGLIPRDSIIIPGHSGDLIGGSHLRSEYNSYIIKDSKFLDPKNIIISKHIESSYDFKNQIDNRLDAELKEAAKEHYFPTEYWNIVNRQAKYINNSVRIYEYYGYEHRLPLWDKQLTQFFLELPPGKRIGIVLYEIYLRKIFRELNIDENIKQDHAYTIRLRPIFNILPNSIKKFLKGIYADYVLKSTDYNNFIAANKLLGCNASTFKELQKGYARWLYAKIVKNRRF